MKPRPEPDEDVQTPDPREDRLPRWAQDTITELRLRLKQSRSEADYHFEQAQAARNAAHRQLAEQGGVARGLKDPDTGFDIPLGNGPAIEFGRFLTARWGVQSDSGGQPALALETAGTGQFVIAPGNFGSRVLILKRTTQRAEPPGQKA